MRGRDLCVSPAENCSGNSRFQGCHLVDACLTSRPKGVCSGFGPFGSRASDALSADKRGLRRNPNREVNGLGMWLDFAQIANDYEIHIFFSRYVRSFVPPWFDETAAEIQRNTGRDFKRIWGWAFDQFMNATNSAYELGTVGRYSFGLYGDMALGATSRISEIYRTSFVSTVDWFARQGWLDESFAAEYCLKICPLDPSLWEIGYSSKPEWWPNAGAEAEITMITEWSACESLVELRQQNFRLFVAEGTITPNPDRPLISTAFRLLPFAYRVH